MVLIRLGIYALLLYAGGAAAENHVLKFATLAPAGSTWMNLIQEWADEVKQKSGGRLTFKLYPGGVSGDEPDVLRKIRYGQLHGGAFTGYGIGQIYSPARVLEFPFLFNDIQEIDAVRTEIMPTLQQGFRARDYELLGWMEAGFVRLFSRAPIRSFDDLKKRRIWLWQGDALGEAFFKASDIAPIPLSVIDVFTSLSTGLIDTVYSPPLAAIAMQWFTKTEYMTDVPMANAIGALLVSEKFYTRLPRDLQMLLKSTGAAAGEKLIAQTRVDNDKSMAVLKQQGLQIAFTQDDVDEKQLLDIRDRAAQELMHSGYIPSELFARVKRLQEAYRAKSRAAAGR